jgi:hypothetical protein
MKQKIVLLGKIWVEVPYVEDWLPGHGVEDVQGEVGHRVLLEIPQVDHCNIKNKYCING